MSFVWYRGRSGLPLRGAWWIAAVLILAVATPGVAAQGDRDARRAERRLALEAARRGEYDLPTAFWREGPVRYLLSKDEDKAFRRLATPEDRVRHIKRFWASRDPDPSSPGNGFRDLFYRRVGEANEYFAGTTKPGWKTDRGKIFIILGPPDERDELHDRSHTLAVILWTYRDPPSPGSVSPNSSIRFVRDHSGEFRLTTAFRITASETTLSIGLQMQAMQVKSIPEPQELLDAVVNTLPPADGAPFRTHQDFFGAERDGTIAVLTLGVRDSLLLDAAPPEATEPAAGAGEPRFEAVARLVRDRRGGPVYDLAGVNGLRGGEGELSQDADGYRLFQGAVTVEPGRYTAYFGIVDRRSGRIHSFRDEFEVPAYRSDRITVSDITLASRLEHLPDRTTFGYSAPFVFGDLRVVPRAGDVLESGDELLVYYQVHGSGIDAIDGRPDFDLEYRVLVSRTAGPDGEPLYTPFGNPVRLTHQQSPVQGYSFRLTDWPPAAYRLEIEVIDNVTGLRSTNGVMFRII